MFRRLKPFQAVVDVVIALVFFVITYLYSALFSANGGSLSEGLVAIGLAAALGFRRFSPAVSLIIAWATALLQMFLLHLSPGFADFAILAVLYATALYGDFVIRRTGFVSVFIGGVVGAVYLSQAGSRSLINLHLDLSSIAEVLRFGLLFVFYLALLLVLLGLPWTLGNLVRARTVARASQSAQALAESEAAAAERDVIVEQERNRIARDMHDVVAHSLAVVIAQADGARYAAKADPNAVDEALTTISSTAREALGEVRLLLGQLRHAQNEGPQPGLADLERMIDQLRGSGLTIAFETRGSPLALGAGQQLAVYRIVQEALTNILRHGDVTREAVVRFDWKPTDLEVTITSSLSSSPKTAELRVGHGLAGMRERAALVGGQLTTEVDDQRFVVRGVIPTAGVLA
jgi:signal transduction histidine kinase